MLQDISAITNIDKFNFPVELRDMTFWKPSSSTANLVTGYPEDVPHSLGRLVVRTDTHEPLGIVGPAWKLTSYGDVLSTFNQSLLESGLDLSDVTVRDEVLEGGAKMKREIIFKRHNIQPQVGDVSQLRLRYYDSYNMNWARQIIFDVMRLWCSNGCAVTALSSRWYSKHTRAEGHIELTAKEAVKTLENLTKVEDKFKQWISTPADENKAKEIYANTIARYRDSKGNWRTSDQLVKDLTENYFGQQLLVNNSRFGQKRDNLYNVYQGATAWATHVKETKRGAPHNIQRSREGQVRQMITSPVWEAAEAA